MEGLFESERRKQRILIDLDQTTILMQRNASALMDRGRMLDDRAQEAEDLVGSSRRLYWKSVPWYKRWLWCCYS